MKNNFYNLLFVLTLCLITSATQAHAIWIEVNPVASLNKPQEVKVNYGEYVAAEIENVDKWYSDLKNLEVWLISPSNQKIKLSLIDRQSFLQTSFTPNEEGTYLITTVHAAKDLGGTTKYQFASNASVSVGQATPVDFSSLALSVFTDSKIYSLKDQVTLQVFVNGEPSPNTEVIVMSASGWSKTFKSNEQGQVFFTPLWSGDYVIETSTYQESQGNWKGNNYSHLWQGSTTFIKVN